MKRFALVGLALLGVAGLGAAQAPLEPVVCHTEAYLADQKQGFYAGPGSQYQLLKQLKPGLQPPMLSIRAGLGNWLRVTDLASIEGQLLFAGPGWVYGPALATSVRGTHEGKSPLYLHPDTLSRVSAQLPAMTEVRVLYCRGTWLKVRSGKSEGWLERREQCPNPVTTCP